MTIDEKIERRDRAQKTSIANARAARDVLETKIADLLMQYSLETGLPIDSVYVNLVESWGTVELYTVDVSVRF